MPVSVITVNKELNSTNTELIFGGIGVFYKEDSIDTQGGCEVHCLSSGMLRDMCLEGGGLR